MIDPERYLATLPRSTERDAEGRRNLALLLEYDGTDFLGFQRQVQEPTVQQTLEEALARILKQDVRVTPAGRTDTGVHAAGQVVNFRTRSPIPADRVAPALNGVLPRSIVALGSTQVAPAFSARYSAQRRVYYYLIWTRPHPSVFLRRFSYHYPWGLDVAAMDQAARALRGTRDYRSFAVEAAAQRTTVREVFWVRCRRRGGLVGIVARANAFLRGMVRAIVGTLLDVGRGKLAPDQMERILAARDRAAASPAAPPEGLCLARVDY